MEIDPISAYQAAFRAREEAILQVKAHVAVIRDAADKLEDWQFVVVLKTAAADIPPPFQMIDASEWPSAKQLADALNRWRHAERAVRDAWKSIPEDRRAIIQPP